MGSRRCEEQERGSDTVPPTERSSTHHPALVLRFACRCLATALTVTPNAAFRGPQRQAQRRRWGSGATACSASRCGSSCLFQRCARKFHQSSAALVFLSHEGGELRRASFHFDGAGILDSLLHFGRRSGARHFCIQHVYDLLWRAGRCEHAGPSVVLEPFHALFGEGGMSGTAGFRFRLVIPSAFRRPALACAITGV